MKHVPILRQGTANVRGKSGPRSSSGWAALKWSPGRYVAVRLWPQERSTPSRIRRPSEFGASLANWSARLDAGLPRSQFEESYADPLPHRAVVREMRPLRLAGRGTSGGPSARPGFSTTRDDPPLA
jgi:hypothetical protein